jgi:hypothetical protein
MKHLHRQVRIAVLSVLSMVVVISVVKLSFATGNVSKGDLAGNWQITLGGVTGCGQSTELADGWASMRHRLRMALLDPSIARPLNLQPG